jgi:predicted small lipoprotein YifL
MTACGQKGPLELLEKPTPPQVEESPTDSGEEDDL